MRISSRSLATVLILELIIACPDDPLCYSCSPRYAPSCTFCEASIINRITNLCDINVNPVVDNCVKYSGKPGATQCDLCYPGYELVDQTCVKCTTENCYWCDKNQICTTCFDHMKLIIDKQNPKNNKCIKDVKCDIPNCEICFDDASGSEKCHICSRGFIPKHGNCLPSTLDNCESANINDESKCEICRYGYYLTDNYSCKARAGVEAVSSYSEGIVWYLILTLGSVVFFALARL